MYRERLKQLRIENGKTQQQIADLLNTTKQYYQKYEKRLHPMPIEHIIRLCHFYGVSADYVLGLPYTFDRPTDTTKICENCENYSSCQQYKEIPKEQTCEDWSLAYIIYESLTEEELKDFENKNPEYKMPEWIEE